MHEFLVKKYRYFLKDSVRKTIDFSETDQSKGMPPPPLEKPFAHDAKRINLIANEKWQHINNTGIIWYICAPFTGIIAVEEVRFVGKPVEADWSDTIAV